MMGSDFNNQHGINLNTKFSKSIDLELKRTSSGSSHHPGDDMRQQPDSRQAAAPKYGQVDHLKCDKQNPLWLSFGK
jgi:hypothetical protein